VRTPTSRPLSAVGTAATTQQPVTNRKRDERLAGCARGEDGCGTCKKGIPTRHEGRLHQRRRRGNAMRRRARRAQNATLARRPGATGWFGGKRCSPMVQRGPDGEDVSEEKRDTVKTSSEQRKTRM
jgi:hypothetical protein